MKKILLIFLLLLLLVGCSKTEDEKIYHTVTFYDYYNQIASTQQVEENQDAIPPVLDPIEGYTFISWSEDYTNVKSEIICLPEYERNFYNVEFVDIEGNSLKKVTVEHGKFTTAPSAPLVTGKTFGGWDKEYSNITDNLIISPIYTTSVYHVSFYDGLTLIETQTVNYNESAVTPTPPLKEGYTFIGWDREFDNVKEDLIVTAIYEALKHSINFLDHEGNIIKTQIVEHGKSGVAPIAPSRNGYIFKEWDKNYQVVNEDIVVNPIYETITYDLVFNPNLEMVKTTWNNKDSFVNELYTDLHSWFASNVSNISGLSFNQGTYTLTLNNQTATWTTPESIKSIDIYVYEKTISNFYYKPITRVNNEVHTPVIDENYFLNSEPYRTKYLDLDRYFLNVITSSYPAYNNGYNHASGGRIQIFFRFQQWISVESIPAFDSLPSKTDLDTKGATIKMPTDLNYNITQNVTIPTPVYSNVEFLGWYDNILGAGSPYTSIPAGNYGKITLYAKWDFDTTKHHILFVDNNNELIIEYMINDGDSITPPTLDNKEGYIFKGWDKSHMNVDKDTTFRAEYDLVEYSITYNKNIDNNDVIIPTTPIKYTIDDNIVLPKASLEGYFFVGWYDNPEYNNSPITETNKGDLDLYAKWVKIGEVSADGLEVVASDYEVLVGRYINLYVKSNNNYLNQNLVTYYLSDLEMATIDEYGYLYAKKAGSLSILVVYQDSEASIEITITDEPLPLKWVGHMGSGGPVVQNTISAFEEGGKRGYYAMESDIRVSADGVYYICHDDVFLPYLFTDSSLHNKLMASYTWAELKDLQIKDVYNGITYYGTLTTVEEYLEICKKYGAKAVLELKWTTGINNNDQSKLSGLVELVKIKGMYEDAIFMTSMRNCLTYLRNNFKDIQLQYLTGSSTTTMDNVNWCIENKMSLDAISTHLTQAMVNKMHEAGFYVNAYTVNVQTTADSLQSMGVDMITTDNLGIE